MGKALASQFSLGNNQYPKSVTEAAQVLSNHTHNNAGRQKSGPSKNTTKDKEEDDKQEGVDVPSLTFAQLEGKCYVCGKGGHMSKSCNVRDKIPKGQWAINKARNAAQQHVHAPTSSTTLQVDQQDTTASQAGTTQDSRDHSADQDKIFWVQHHQVGELDVSQIQKSFHQESDIMK